MTKGIHFPEQGKPYNVIDVINDNDPHTIIRIDTCNPDGGFVVVFSGMVKDIPDNLNECEVLLMGFDDCFSITVTGNKRGEEDEE